MRASGVVGALNVCTTLEEFSRVSDLAVSHDNLCCSVGVHPDQPASDATTVEHLLERSGMTCNKNGIPFDPEKPFVTSGVRLGTPAGTTRGFGEAEYREIGKLIVEVLDGLREANSDEGNAVVEAAVRDKVTAMTARFPIYAD